jgi:hypothetical protein
MNRLFSILLLPGFACTCVFAQGSTGTSTTTTTTNYVFPPVGLASGLTASINLVNIAPASTAANAAAPVCNGTVTFANATGTTIGTPTTFKTGTGMIDTVTLTASAAGVTSSTPRAEILASVQQTTTRPATPPCSLVFSLEIYDSTGVTRVFLGNTAASTPPSPVGIEFGR